MIVNIAQIHFSFSRAKSDVYNNNRFPHGKPFFVFPCKKRLFLIPIPITNSFSITAFHFLIPFPLPIPISIPLLFPAPAPLRSVCVIWRRRRWFVPRLYGSLLKTNGNAPKLDRRHITIRSALSMRYSTLSKRSEMIIESAFLQISGKNRENKAGRRCFEKRAGEYHAPGKNQKAKSKPRKKSSGE